MSELEIVLTIVERYGIQMFMLIWFMFRLEKIIKANTEALNQMRTEIASRMTYGQA